MSWQVTISITILLLLVLFYLSIVNSALSRLSRVSLKTLAEKRQGARSLMLAKIAADRSAFVLPFTVAIHLIEITTTLLCYSLLAQLEVPSALAWTFGILVLIDLLLRQLLPDIMTVKKAERRLVQALPVLSRIYRPFQWISFPISFLLARYASKPDTQDPGEATEEESGDEQIHAYIEAGAEEGIIEQHERKLIQSALKFDDTLVREIMTPRNEIVSVSESATFAELRRTFVSSKHSRLPVYRDRPDQIVGVVFLRHFLSNSENFRRDEPIRSLIDEAMFVPETKKVADLLKEFQKLAGNMAIVVNEYGTVTGLVTMEDLVEEIVGEIHDEDELQREEVEKVGEGVYLVLGSAEVEDLEDQLGVQLNQPDVTTMSGLVVKLLGKVPSSGESLSIDPGLKVEVLSADRRRIHKLRVRVTAIHDADLESAPVAPAQSAPERNP